MKKVFVVADQVEEKFVHPDMVGEWLEELEDVQVKVFRDYNAAIPELSTADFGPFYLHVFRGVRRAEMFVRRLERENTKWGVYAHGLDNQPSAQAEEIYKVAAVKWLSSGRVGALQRLVREKVLEQ